MAPEEGELILRAINLILEADKNLASCAMSKAQCAGGDPDALAEAEGCFNDGLAETALEDGRSANLTVSNLSLKDNVKQGLFLKNCDLRFDANDLLDWSISGSEVVIAGEGSDLVFSSVAIRGGSEAAVSIVDGTMTANTSVFSDRGPWSFRGGQQVHFH